MRNSIKKIFVLSNSIVLFLCAFTSYGEEHGHDEILRGNGMNFLVNKGQLVDMDGHTRPDLLYGGDGGGAKVYLREYGVSYVMTKIEGMNDDEKDEEELHNYHPHKRPEEMLATAILKGHRVDMDFLGAVKNPKRREESEVEGYSNYYLGRCPDGITGVRGYNKIVYEEIYKNIDVVYYGGKAKGLKYDIVVKPSGRVEDIVMKYSGAEDVRLVNGSLKIITSVGEFGEGLPKIYQNIDGEQIEVVGRYELSNEEVRIHIENYDKSKELIIDPWVTYYGGSGVDNMLDIAADENGNVVVTGFSESPDFPVSPGAFQKMLAGNTDAFVVKLNKAGNRLWATYYGGIQPASVAGYGYEFGYGVVIDKQSNIIMAGHTTCTDFPVTVGAYQPNLKGPSDGFVVKFNSSGSRLWATYCGGSDVDRFSDIAVDKFNNLIIVGLTNSKDFPGVGQAYQKNLNGGGWDACVVKFSSSGNLLWSTYYGGNGADTPVGVALDAMNNVMICGTTTSNSIPVTADAFQKNYGGGPYDGFIAKFDSVGGKLLWATFLGGWDLDECEGVAIDKNNNLIITGWTWSSNFHTTPGAFQFQAPSPGCAFVIKFDKNNKLLWSTYLGGSGGEEGHQTVVDEENNIYVSGDSYSHDFPVSSCAYQKNHGTTGENSFVSKFTSEGKYLAGTYMGSDDMPFSDDENAKIARGGGYIYFTILQKADGSNYPVTPGAYQTIATGAGTPVIAQLCSHLGVENSAFDFTVSNANICAGSSVNYNVIPKGDCDTIGATCRWYFPGGTPITSDEKNPTGIVYSTSGVYDVKLVTIACGKDSVIKKSYITVKNLSVAAGADVSICSGDSVQLNASGGNMYTWIPSIGLDNAFIANPKASPTVTTTYEVTAWDSAGCSGKDSVVITVHPRPLAKVSNDTTICFGDSATLTASGGTHYLWSTGDTTASIKVRPATSTKYFISVSNDNACSNKDSVTVVVRSQMQYSFAPNSVNLGLSNVGKPKNGKAVFFNQNFTDVHIGGIHFVPPSFGTITTSFPQTVLGNDSLAIQFTCTAPDTSLHNGNLCIEIDSMCHDERCIPVSIEGASTCLTPQVASATIGKQPGDEVIIPIVLDPSTKFINAKTINAEVKYDPTLLHFRSVTSTCDPSPKISSTTGNIILTISPTNTLSTPTAIIANLHMQALLAPYAKGEMEVASSCITLQSGEQIVAINCPESFSLDSSCIMPHDLRERSTATIEGIYPNPTQGNTKIVLNVIGSPNVQLEVFDIFGRKVQSVYHGIVVPGSHALELETNSLNNGVYFCRLINGNLISMKEFTVNK